MQALVMKLNRNYIQVNKSNLLEYYVAVHKEAFKTTTVTSAFCKTGIHPFNRNTIPAISYEPTKNYTTKAAHPIAI